MAQAFHNPQATIQQTLQNDPRTQQVMNVINQNGGNAKETFYKIAKEKGVDPDEFINQVKKMF